MLKMHLPYIHIKNAYRARLIKIDIYAKKSQKTNKNMKQHSYNCLE